MARITIIDDDYSLEILAENLRYLGHEVTRYPSAVEALAAIGSIAASDIVVLDIIMERPSEISGQGISGGRTTGMSIFQQLRRMKSDLPILAYTATQDKDLIDTLLADPHTTFFRKWSTPSLREVVEKIEQSLGIKREDYRSRPFIVHGHDEAAKLEVKNYLQNTLKLPEPIILHEQPNLGRTLIEKFEDYAAHSNLAFVILTPDDKVIDSGQKDDDKRRARQNVIFELGFFLGILGRTSGRVFLLHKGPLELSSGSTGLDRKSAFVKC